MRPSRHGTFLGPRWIVIFESGLFEGITSIFTIFFPEVKEMLLAQAEGKVDFLEFTRK